MNKNKYKPKMTETQRKQAMTLYNEGKSLIEIAKKYGISQQALGKTLRKRGLKTHQADKSFKFSNIEKSEIQLLVKNGASQVELAERYKKSLPTIVKLLKELNIYKKRRSERTEGWTYSKVISRVKELSRSLGRTPMATEWDAPNTPTFNAIMIKFDKKWNNIILDAKLTPTIQYGIWDKPSLEKKFKSLVTSGQLKPFKGALTDNLEMPSTSTINSLYGNWSNFLKECGMESLDSHHTWVQWEYCCAEIARSFYGKIDFQLPDYHVVGNPHFKQVLN